MAWASLTLVTDAELGTMEPETTNGSWGSVTWPNQRAEAKKDIKIWLQNDFARLVPEGAIVADRVRDTFGADKVWGFVGAGYTDVTTTASDDTEDDVDLSDVFVTVANDRIYIGNNSSFDGLDVSMLSTLNTNASVLTVKYSGPGGWTALTATDGTANSGKTLGQSGRITWTQPGSWQRRTLDSSADAYYWIELSVSAALTSGTSVGQLLTIQAPDGLKRACALQTLGYIATNLASQSPSTDYWHFKARNQFKTGWFDLAEKLYAEMRDKGGIPIDLNNDGKIDASETNITSPLRIGRA